MGQCLTKGPPAEDDQLPIEAQDVDTKSFSAPEGPAETIDKFPSEVSVRDEPPVELQATCTSESVVSEETAPGDEEVESNWKKTLRKQQYLDAASGIADKFDKTSLPGQGPAVFALIAGVLCLLDDSEDADIIAEVERHVGTLDATLREVSQHDKKSPWLQRILDKHREYILEKTRPLGPSLSEPLEVMQHKTNRPTEGTKQKVRRAVAKRLALQAASTAQHPAVAADICRWMLKYGITASLAQRTEHFKRGPYRFFESQIWYAFWAHSAEVASWKWFYKAFRDWKLFPAGTDLLVRELDLQDENAAAWKVFRGNLQGSSSALVRAACFDRAFPEDLLGEDFVCHLRQLFTVPGNCTTTDKRTVKTLFGRMCKDYDRQRRESSAQAATDTLWEMVEKVWYMDGALKVALDAGAGARVLAALEQSTKQTSQLYLPASVLLALLCTELSKTQTNLQRIANLLRREFEGNAVATARYQKFAKALIRAQLATNPLWWKDAFGSKQPEDWPQRPIEQTPVVMFAHLDAFLATTKPFGHPLDEPFLGEPMPCASLAAVSSNLRRFTLCTLTELAMCRELRMFFTEPQQAEEWGTYSLLHTLTSVVSQQADSDEGRLAVEVLSKLPSEPVRMPQAAQPATQPDDNGEER